ncbi:MAG TPA: SBBP repeat-containing protein, partial [Bryobacteraceae bacterium]|nr:SBBP repeat-containing protein [Bryobacteraceae bacterium]
MHIKRNLLIVWIATCAVLAANPAGDTVPLVFIANRGQAPATVRFMAKGSGLTAFFSPEEALFRMGDAFVRVQFAGARPGVEVEGLERQPGEANFLIGPQEEWRLGVPLYGGVVYRELYPGIDMVYGGRRQDLKSEFLVAPGADPARIQLRYVGTDELRIDESGALVIVLGGRNAGRELREQAPVLYQQRDGQRVPVDGRFTLSGGVVGFIVNDYDADLPLIIDPVLSYSTLLGGSSSDAATALAVDASGSAYVAGFTASYDFPTASPEQNFNAGGNDAFVAKLNPSGNGLIYSTYLGGQGDDRAYGIAVDASGAAYLTGSTASSNFPVVHALQSKLAGAKNAFVAKLSPAGNSLVYSTFLGGSASDTGNGIAVDGSGNAYVVGDTTSLNFPAGGLQKANGGGQDAFVAKVGANGGTLVYSSYLGGANDDHGAAIAVDSGGTAYITGSTWSTNFPVANAWQGAIGGGQDAFVARFSANGNSLLFSTYLGGSGGSLGYPESGNGIALDGQGNAYIAGATPSGNFPVLNAFDSFLSGSSDAFVAEMNASGVLVYSTYLGGTGMDTANAIAVDAVGNAYVVGQTVSSDLPVTGAFQAAYGGDYDAFAGRLSPAGALVWLSYLGGSAADTATAVALDPAANVYIAGWTLSSNFPVLNAYQSANGGNYGAFVAKVASGAAGAPPVAVSVAPNSGSGYSQTFSFQVSDSLGAADLTTVSVLINSSTSTTNACSVTYTRAANTLMLLTDGGAAPGGTIAPGSGSQQNSQCVLNGAGSSVSAAGNVLTLNLAITFQAAFAGARNVYLQAVNPFGSIGWQSEGAWTVTVGPPAPVSVTPNSGNGTSQTFTFVFSDQQGYSGIIASLIFNSSLSGGGACYLVYYPGNVLYLVNDSGSGWTGPG